MKILFKYSDGDYEMFEGDEKEARYWFERRIEKAGKYVEEGWMFDDSPLDIEGWKRDYEEKVYRQEKQQREEEERLEYERLKRKFEK